MAIQGHSKSRVFGSLESLRGTPYPYIKTLALSLKFPKIQQPAKTLKFLSRELERISTIPHKPFIARN